MSVWLLLYLFLNIAMIGALIYTIVVLVPFWKVPASKAFIFLAGTLILWITALINQSTIVFSPNAVIFLHRFTESCFLLIPFAMIVLLDRYATVSRIMHPGLFLLFGIIFLVTVGLIWTNQFHQIYWQTETLLMDGNRLQVVATKTTIAAILKVILHLQIAFTAFHLLNLTFSLNKSYQKLTIMIATSLVLTAIFSAIPLISEVDSPYTPLSLVLPAFTVSLAHLIIQHSIFDLAVISRTTYFDHIGDGALMVSSTGTVIDVSAQIKNRIGAKNVEKMIGKDILKRFPEWTVPFQEALKTRNDQKTSVSFQRETETVEYDITIHPNEDHYGSIPSVLIKFQDVTFYRHLLDQLNELAIRDPLTGVLNRRHFELLVLDHLKLAKRYQRSGCLMMFDLDGFKAINDLYGHQIGDRALTTFTQQMTEFLRTSDIFARYGGDEFVLYLPETTIDGALKAIEHMQKFLLGTTIEIDGEVIPLKCSVGAVPISPETINLSYQELLRQADQAMYAAKGNEAYSVGILQPDGVAYHDFSEVEARPS